MQIELNAPSHLISLSTSSHLVNVTIRTWSATSQNRKISNEVTSAKNADADAGRFTQNLLAKAPEHRALCNHRQTVYNWLQRVTYDWAGDWRIDVVAIEMDRRGRVLRVDHYENAITG